MTTTTTFAGFPLTTRPFLRALRDHADAAWFHAHRDEYRTACDAPAKALVTALGAHLPALSPDLRADPAVGGSIFRITRDRRFAPDALPYKGYIDVWVWEGDRALAPGGLYLRLTPDVVRISVGARTFGREALARYRRAVLDPVAGAALVAVVADLAERGVEVTGQALRGLPRGIAPADVAEGRGDLLRHTALLADATEPADGLAEDGEALIATTLAHWSRAWPLHRWLVDHVQG